MSSDEHYEGRKTVEREDPQGVGERQESQRVADRDDDSDPFKTYSVVINIEDQYSIWPQGRDVPAGWKEVGHSGSKAECLKYIEENWTDMRPKSVKERRA